MPPPFFPRRSEGTRLAVDFLSGHSVFFCHLADCYNSCCCPFAVFLKKLSFSFAIDRFFFGVLYTPFPTSYHTKTLKKKGT